MAQVRVRLYWSTHEQCVFHLTSQPPAGMKKNQGDVSDFPEPKKNFTKVHPFYEFGTFSKRTVEKNPPDGIPAFGEKLHVTIPKKGVKTPQLERDIAPEQWFLFRGDVMLALCRISFPANSWDFPQPVAEWSWSVAPTSSRVPHLRNHLRPTKWVFNMAPTFIAHDHTKTLQCC